MTTEKIIREAISTEFDSCASIIKNGNQVWLVKLPYLPFADMGKDYFILDAYYLASNQLYHKIHKVVRQLNQQGIAASRRKERDFKELIVLSGLSYGCRRNSLAYDDKFGSRFVIGAINIPLEKANNASNDPNNGIENNNLLNICASCMLCVAACPTGAISTNGLNAEKCLRHYMHLGAYPDKDTAKAAGHRLLGCDICQRVCPYNNDKEAPVPDKLKEVLQIENFVESLPKNKTILAEYIGANYAKVHWLTSLAEQLLK